MIGLVPVNVVESYIRMRVYSWRETIRTASCEEYMPGALADAIEAYDAALNWLESTSKHYDRLLEKAANEAEVRAIAQVLRELWRCRFRVKEDLKAKVAEYRQAMLSREPVGMVDALYAGERDRNQSP